MQTSESLGRFTADIADHFLLVILMIVIYVQLHNFLHKEKPAVFSTIFGSILALFAIVSIFFPLEIATGVHVDSKLIITLIATLYGGIIAGTITSVASISARMFIGGAGAITGVSGVITSLLIGLLVKVLFERKLIRISKIWIYLALGILMVGNQVLWDFLLPFDLAIALLKLDWLPITLVYVPSVVIICKLFDFYELQISLRNDLSESEKYNALLFDSHRTPIIVMDSQSFKYIRCNNAAVEIYGYKAISEVIGLTPLDVSAAIQYDGTPSHLKAKEYIDTCVREGAVRFEWLHQRPNGEQWDAQVYLMLFEWKGLQTIQFTLDDITQQKRDHQRIIENEMQLRQQNEEFVVLNEELAEANHRIQEYNNQLLVAKDKAEESDRLKTAFLANMSHEIRTPMNAIVGFSELVTDPETEEIKRFQFANIVQSSCHQLLTVVNDILDISRIQTGQLEISKSATDINAIINQSITLYRSKAFEKEINLLAVFPSGFQTIFLETDTMRLSQIINNLLSNAIKFTDKGSVQLGYNVQASEVVFFVKDSGIGVAHEHQQRIFERFQQAEYFRDRHYGGTGLGLAICKSLVELLGGRIWVESELNRGSSFYFTLPLLNGNIIEAKAHKEVTADDWSSYTILVAEDEQNNFLLLLEALSRFKLRVLHARDGAEAINFCRNHPEINLVLMDIKMPVMNGYDATREILQHRPQLPIIATTAYALTSEIKQSLLCGMVAHLSKPIDRSELIERLKEFLPKVS